MSHEVLTSVRSIMASFINSFDVTTTLRDRKRRNKKSRTEAQIADRETNALSRSLEQSPWIIGHEYENGLRGAGPHFAHGDGIATTRLNEILLRLNTGLVNIIASFLTHDTRHEPEVDYRALTALSEASRKDSIRALHQLYQRMMSRRLPAIMTKRQNTHSRDSSVRRQARPPAAQTKIRGPTIAQVTIVDSSRRPQLAIVKPSGHAKKRAASASRTHSPRTPSTSSSATVINASSQLSLGSRKDGRMQSSDQLLPTPKLNKQHSTADVKQSSKSSRAKMKSTPEQLPAYSALDKNPLPQPPVSPAIPRQNIAPRRITPTMYSIATDSTKLGEIPYHKRAVPYDFDAMSMLNREALQNGWPLRDIDGKPLVRPKKRFAWFGLRKKQVFA